MNNIVKKVVSDEQKGKCYTTEVITNENLDEMFERPQDYVDDSFDLPIMKLYNGDEEITVLLGVNSDGKAYIALENDEVSEDFYPSYGETLWDAYETALADWKVGE